MKILWFGNTYSILNKKINSSGAWLNLEYQEIIKQPVIELGYAFLSDESSGIFEKNSTKFYKIQRFENTKFKRFVARLYKLEHIKYYENIYSQVINDFQPDVIHIHGTEKNFGIIQKITDKPVVIKLQGILNSIYNKSLHVFNSKNIKKKDSIINSITGRSFKWQIKNLEKKAEREYKILKNAKYIIGRTNFDRYMGLILAPKAKYFYNSVILRPVFYKTKWSHPKNNVIRIFTIMNGAIYKGLEIIFRTIYLLNKKKINVKWYIAGLNRTDKIVKLVNKLMNGNNVMEYISFLGACDENILVSQMLKANIYVQVSHIENSPNSLSEAQMIGMPCIASFAGGTSSLLTEDYDGLLYQDGDYFSLAGSILELYSNKKKAKRLAENARDTALARHDKKTIISRSIEIYKYVIRKNS